MTSKTTREGTQTVEVVTYDYNLQNRLARVATTPYVENVAQTPEVTEYAYNPDGIRISKTVDGTYLTKYLIDPANHTGYAQVLQETRYDVTTPESRIPLSRTDYVIGDDVISQTKSTYSAGTWTAGQTQYLLYDGHGSTRQLVNHQLLDQLPVGAPDGTGETPQIADTYSYDGYGVMLDSTDGAQAASNAAANGTNLLYCGEQYDSQADQYYLRARCYNPMNGLFNRMDDFAGNLQDPQSLHKYLYCHANPLNATDPTGQFSLMEISFVQAISKVIRSTRVQAAWKIYNIADVTIEAIEFVGQLYLTGTVNPLVAASLAADITPFGKICKTIKRVGKLFARAGQLADTAGDLTDIYRHMGSGKKAAEAIGELGAEFTATALDLRKVDNFEAAYHGFDYIYKNKQGIYVIVEAKGGAGTLGRTVDGAQQMSKMWIRKGIDRVGKQSQNLADELMAQYNKGTLEAMVVYTKFDNAGNVLDPVYEMKNINQIGPWNY